MQQIKSLSKQIAATYQSAVPSQQSSVKAPPVPTDRVDALKKLHNTRSNITKWTKKRDNAADPAAADKAQKKLDQLEAYKNSLEIFLKEEEEKVDE